TLQVREDDTVIGNTPIVSTKERKDGFKEVELAETKPLPSYLVAFAVGPFELLEGGTAGTNKTPVRVVVPRGEREGALYAAASTRFLIDTLESYFGLPFPYPKLDVVVIPNLSSFGAMENAGLITISGHDSMAKP